LIPAWVDRREYPFEPRGLDVEGGRLSYVDEGEGAPMWSFAGDRSVERVARFFGGRLGRHLYERRGFSVRVMQRYAVADRRRYTKAVERHYLEPLDGHATWVYARELLGSSAWFDELWRRRDRIARIPAILICAGEPAVPHTLSRAVGPRRRR